MSVVLEFFLRFSVYVQSLSYEDIQNLPYDYTNKVPQSWEYFDVSG